MLILFQSDVSASHLDLTYLILACFGVLIILICIGAYLFGYGSNLKDRVQEIAAFGAQFKISVITFFILVGVLLIVPLVWKQFNDTVKSLNEAREGLLADKKSIESERDALKIKLEQLTANQSKEQTVLLELEGIKETEILEKKDFNVVCQMTGDAEPQTLEFQIVRGRPNRIKLVFSDIRARDVFPSLQVIHTRDDKRWGVEYLTPTTPVITIKKVQDE